MHFEKGYFCSLSISLDPLWKKGNVRKYYVIKKMEDAAPSLYYWRYFESTHTINQEKECLRTSNALWQPLLKKWQNSTIAICTAILCMRLSMLSCVSPTESDLPCASCSKIVTISDVYWILCLRCSKGSRNFTLWITSDHSKHPW